MFAMWIEPDYVAQDYIYFVGIRKWKRLTKSEKAFYQQQSAFNNYTNVRT